MNKKNFEKKCCHKKKFDFFFSEFKIFVFLKKISSEMYAQKIFFNSEKKNKFGPVLDADVRQKEHTQKIFIFFIEIKKGYTIFWFLAEMTRSLTRILNLKACGV